MKLSIITVNFNNRDGLQRTIDSVVCQTWRDFEWIIIDGGSTDGSKELIEQYQSHFAYWCSEPDKGVYDAMNKGIDKARGEWINFMNSGDCFVNARVLSEVFDGKTYPDDVKILLGNTIFIYPFHYYVVPSCDEIGNTHFCHQSTFTKTAELKQYKFDTSYRIVADRVLVQKIQESKGKLLCIPYTISIYDACSGLSASNWIDSFKEACRMNHVPKNKDYYLKLIHFYARLIKKRFKKFFIPKQRNKKEIADLLQWKESLDFSNIH